MILSSASSGFAGAWAVAVAAVAAYVVAALRGAEQGRGPSVALVIGIVLHALLLVLDIGGVGNQHGAKRMGLGPVVSLTVWLVLAVHALESRLVPQPGVRRVLALLGAAAVLLAWALPGEPHALQGSPLAPLHWVLGVGAYGLFGAAVLHAAMLDAAETRLRRHVGTPGARGMPLLQLERLTFRFVELGFVVLSAALLLGVLTGPQWRWTHKNVFSLLGWAVIAALLVGRKRYGWRGRRATRWLYAGALLLLLAYAGSRFVLQFVLGRPVD
jgi:ABC-type uncharacterized transport system permease subunit